MSDANSKRAVAYLRVSSISQVDGHSLNAQERLFNQLCESRGWAAVRVYREEGQSAHSESVKKRPIFRQLMEDAKRDQFDIVVVHTLDRWSRNLRVTLGRVGRRRVTPCGALFRRPPAEPCMRLSVSHGSPVTHIQVLDLDDTDNSFGVTHLAYLPALRAGAACSPSPCAWFSPARTTMRAP